MIVYLATVGWDCEGFEVLGVFSTREEAHDACNQCTEYYDYQDVLEYSIGETKI